MSMLIEAGSSREPRLTTGARVRLVPAAPSLWRVVDSRGIVIGHLQEAAHPAGVRFRARRLHATAHTFRELGDFWTADEAVECLRFAR